MTSKRVVLVETVAISAFVVTLLLSLAGNSKMAPASVLSAHTKRSASIIAITVAFALAIDSTIHFLNRFNLEEQRLGLNVTDGSRKARYYEALVATASHIGPAVVLTTIVLALGLGVTMLSDLPSLRLFGRLTAVCLAASVIGQLVILPASIALYRRTFG